MLVAKDKSQWQQAIYAYEAQGMGEKEAFQMALKDQLMSMVWSGIGGGLSGGVMAGGSVAINSAMESYQSREMKMEPGVQAGQVQTDQLQAEQEVKLPPAVEKQTPKLLPRPGEVVEAQKTAPEGEAVKVDVSRFDSGILSNLNKAREYFVNYAKAHFPSSVVNTETGKKIGISRKGIDKFLSGRIAWEKYASGFHIPELIKTAHKVAGAPNTHVEQAESIPTYEYYDSPFEIEGKRYMAHIRVRNTMMGDRYYGHTISEIEDIKIEPSARTSVPVQPAVQPVYAIDDSTSDPIIPGSGDGVNREYAEGGAKYTGKPEVKLPPVAEQPAPKLLPKPGEKTAQDGDWASLARQADELFPTPPVMDEASWDSLMGSDTGLGARKDRTTAPKAQAGEPFIQMEQTGEFVDDRTAAEKAMVEEHRRKRAEQGADGEPTYRMTPAMEKLGMEPITRPITDTGVSESLRANSKAYQEREWCFLVCILRYDKVLKNEKHFNLLQLISGRKQRKRLLQK